MQKNTFTHALAAKWCLLILSILLLLSACGSTSTPAAQPNTTPPPTPTQSPNYGGGYSIITLLNQEIHLFLVP